jgi:hypothetical protein
MLLSATTEKVDRGDKMRIYARLLKVGEYFLFDPFSGVFEGATSSTSCTRAMLRRNRTLEGGCAASSSGSTSPR